MIPEQPSSARGLPPGVVQAWQARIGCNDPIGDNPTRYFRRTGREGLANYTPALGITPADADGFDEIAFWRPLSEMMVYALIRTPCTISRTPEMIKQYSSPYLVVGTQTLPGGGRFRQGDADYVYRNPQHMLVFDNNEPYEQTSYQIADVAGVWVPVDLLGKELGSRQRVRQPVFTDTPLARAAAAFIRNFAFDVAARGADVDADTELAAIDLVRATLGQQDSTLTLGGVSNNPVYIREATRALVEHHFRDPGFAAESIAEALHMSRRHLYRCFEGAKETPATMIANRRLDRARELLEHRETTALDAIALASGFASASTLRNRFRAAFSMTPNEYRQSHQAAQARHETIGPSTPRLEMEAMIDD